MTHDAIRHLNIWKLETFLFSLGVPLMKDIPDRVAVRIADTQGVLIVAWESPVKKK